MPTQLWRTDGTSIDDFIVLTGADDNVNGGTGDDLIIGDGPAPFTYGTTNSLASPANLDSPVYWSTIENPLFADAAIPHASLFVRADPGQAHYGSVTVGSGQTITIDVDFGNFSAIGENTNVVVTLYDSLGNVLATNNDSPYFVNEGAGSVTVNDSYLTYTNSTGSAATYTIGFSEYPLAEGADDGGVFEGGETFVANISVTGHDASAATSGSDALTGGEGNDTLIGQGGDDRLYGKIGSDDLFGGSGNDLLDGGDWNDRAWYSDAPSAVVVDLRRAGPQDTSGAGIDTLVSIENLAGSAFGDILMGDDNFNDIRGGAGDDTIFGNGTQDLLYGEAGNDILFGGDGDDHLTGDVNDYSTYYNDMLFGEAGNDLLNGWLGNDRLYGGDGDDVMYEAGGDDTIDGGSGIDEIQYWGGSGPVTVDLSITGPQNTGQGVDTITNVENVTGTGGGDTLTGTDGDNRLNGWWGNDTLYGAGGNDRLLGDTGDDRLDGGAGSDTADYSSVNSAVTVNLASGGAQDTMGGGVDTLISIENVLGTGSNDTLYGSTAANVMDGGWGDDQIRGQGGDDTLYGSVGNDTLLGGNGNDFMDGGDGVDTASYSGASAGVTVNLSVAGPQNTGQGIDTLVSIENLIGAAFADTLTGDSNANRLNGAGGADSMAGGGGNDVYIVDNSGDTVAELPGGGTDTVQSSVSFALGGNVERLTLTGSANVNAIGNSLNNVLTGNGGDNFLVGLLGNDTLSGKGGADTFRFNTALNASTNVDTITDFAAGTDHIQLDDDIFTQAGAIGTLAAGAFYAGSAAHDASDRIIYDPVSGNLYYDADGNGSVAAILFAHLQSGLALTNADIEIIG
jgi:Ca2+-binding RTX toxin-like protein